jgi:hypothetical protein
MKRIILVVSGLMLSWSFSPAQTVIPNQGFESWTNVGSYENPDNWDNLNVNTASSGIFTCTKGSPGDPGTSYIKLTSKTVTGIGIVPGVAVCGVLDHSTNKPLTGFPYARRPEKLTGNWQFMMYGTGKGYIDVTLTRWNTTTLSRDIISSNHTVLNGMVMSWQAFSITLSYQNGAVPDTCILFLSASGNVPANQDYLYVDNLVFTGEVLTVEQESSAARFAYTVFPNPANDRIQISLPGVTPGQFSVELFTSDGQSVLFEPLQVPVTTISTDLLPDGSYNFIIWEKKRTILGTGKVLIIH